MTSFITFGLKTPVKLELEVKINITLEQTTKAQRGSMGYSSTLPLTSGLDGGEWMTPRPRRFTPRKDPVPIVQEAGWTPGPVWTCEENVAPKGFRSPNRPAHSQSLYRLRYPADWFMETLNKKLIAFWYTKYIIWLKILVFDLIHLRIYPLIYLLPGLICLLLLGKQT